MRSRVRAVVFLCGVLAAVACGSSRDSSSGFGPSGSDGTIGGGSKDGATDDGEDEGGASGKDAGKGNKPDAGTTNKKDGGTTTGDSGGGSNDGGSITDAGSAPDVAWPLGDCAAGETQCDGSGGVQACELIGSKYTWAAATPCTTGDTCSAGQCMHNAITITADTELCGDNAYAGPFVLQGGAKLRCSTGDLTISAPSIFIDPSSSIDVSGASTTKIPAQQSSGGFCSQSSGSGAGGGGGGYGGVGGQGGDGLDNYYNVHFGNQCMFCGGGYGGPVQGSANDAVVTSGWPGGTGCTGGYQYQCSSTVPGGAGGGVVRLIASADLTIQGKVLSDGTAGTGAGGWGGGGGGGSGGGILLVSPSVTLGPTSVVSAKGGTGGVGGNITCAQEGSGSVYSNGGAGGQGRVKILHGGTFNNQGSISGVQSVTWMPPVTFSSTSHPDEDRYYNDDFAGLQVSWQVPYSGAIGSWYLLDQSEATVLSPANGTFTAANSLSFPQAQMTSVGDWFLHLLTVNTDSTVATVSNAFKVHINGTPHAIASSSHPSEASWYPLPAKGVATFSWTPPSGVPANSFIGVWYTIDHTTEPPLPNKTGTDGWTFTTNPQVLIQTDLQGNALTAGTWYFHVVSEDTMGNLTKAVGNYQLQLGAQPATRNFFGYVKNSSGTPVASAKVGLQPYGLTATTDSNGYFIFSSVFDQTYTITATKGSSQASAVVQVNATSSPYNVLLN